MRSALIVLVIIAASQIAGAEAPFNLDSHRGKIVLVDFWASWCVPCRRSFPWWNSMHAKYADEGLVIIGVNLDNDSDSAQEFLEEFPADFTIFYDENKELAK